MSMRFTRGMWLPFKSGDAHVLIQSQTVGAGGAASITFSSIPSTYKHLQVRGLVRDTNTGTSIGGFAYQLNGDSGSNYAWHLLKGDGTSAASTGSATTMFLNSTFGAPADGTLANAYGASVLDILDYASTSKYKTARRLEGVDLNGSGSVGIVSGVWMNTAAVTSVSIIAAFTGFKQYSTFALYGIA